MGPYSHFVIAHQIAEWVHPVDLKAYFWGAVAPDVRYLIPTMRRSQTHLPAETILASMERYPDLKDFLKGYLVHCLCDELDVPGIIQKMFPFSHQKNGTSTRQGTVILEFFNVLRVKPIRQPLPEGYNAFLRGLGVGDREANRFAAEVEGYLAAPTLMSMVSLYQTLGLVGDKRIEKYRDAVALFQRNWLQKNLILFGLQVGKVNEQIAFTVRSIYPIDKV